MSMATDFFRVMKRIQEEEQMENKTVIEFAESRLAQEDKERENGADNQHDINYWRAYLDGARAQAKEFNENGAVFIPAEAPNDNGIRTLKERLNKALEAERRERSRSSSPSYDGAFLAAAERDTYLAQMWLERGWFMRAYNRVGSADIEKLWQAYVDEREFKKASVYGH